MWSSCPAIFCPLSEDYVQADRTANQIEKQNREKRREAVTAACNPC